MTTNTQTITTNNTDSNNSIDIEKLAKQPLQYHAIFSPPNIIKLILDYRKAHPEIINPTKYEHNTSNPYDKDVDDIWYYTNFLMQNMPPLTDPYKLLEKPQDTYDYLDDDYEELDEDEPPYNEDPTHEEMDDEYPSDPEMYYSDSSSEDDDYYNDGPWTNV